MRKSSLMFVPRPQKRKIAPVSDSWKRLERWYKKYLPEVFETLRPPASKSKIKAFEKATGLIIPEDWRESLMIHDGQKNLSHPGAIIGEPFDSLEQIQRNLMSNRSVVQSELDKDISYGWDERCTSSPEEAIRCQDWNYKWVPLGDWDGNCWGIDFDPGPTGVLGQIIDFGRDIESKHVLAMSLAQFLQDLADEMEAGNATVVRELDDDNPDGETSCYFGPPESHKNRDWCCPSLSNFHSQWSQAKLPNSFKYAAPREIEAILPGKPAAGSVARQAQACVELFIEAMHRFELEWLKQRPIGKLGYEYVEESVPGISGSTPSSSVINAQRGWSTLGLGSYTSKCYGFNAIPMPKSTNAEKKLELFVHTKKVLRQRNAIRNRYCTERERSDALTWVQCCPPAHDPAILRVTEIRQLTKDQIIVYLSPIDGITNRYHLKLIGKEWRIDLRDQTSDHLKFKRVPL